MGATKTIVTKEIAFVGMRVCRGRDWIWGSQDGSSSTTTAAGTISKLEGEDWVEVKWDKGITGHYSYRVGSKDEEELKYDLYLWIDEVEAVKPAPEITPLTSESGVQVGDKIRYAQVSIGYGQAGIEIGEIVEVMSTHDTGGYVITSSKPGYWVPLRSFDQIVSKTSKVQPSPLSGVEVGDAIRFAAHSGDSGYANLFVGEVVRVTRVDPGKYVMTSKRENYWVRMECFDQIVSKVVKEPTKVGLSSTTGMIPGFTQLRCIKADVSGKVSVGDVVTVAELHRTMPTIVTTSARPNWWVNIGYFEAGGSVLSVHFDEPKKEAGMTKAEAQYVRVGDEVIYVDSNVDLFTRELLLGKTYTVEAIAPSQMDTHAYFRVSEGGLWMRSSAFKRGKRKSELDAIELLRKGVADIRYHYLDASVGRFPSPKTTSASISSTIKTSKHVTTSGVRAERRSNGYAIKIQRASFKIRQGEDRGEQPIRLGRSQVKAGRVHS